MYKIVVADSHWPRDGKHVEAIGLYSPIAATKEEVCKLLFDASVID
jgi:ribosomal protein S16